MSAVCIYSNLLLLPGQLKALMLILRRVKSWLSDGEDQPSDRISEPDTLAASSLHSHRRLSGCWKPSNDRTAKDDARARPILVIQIVPFLLNQRWPVFGELPKRTCTVASLCPVSVFFSRAHRLSARPPRPAAFCLRQREQLFHWLQGFFFPLELQSWRRTSRLIISHVSMVSAPILQRRRTLTSTCHSCILFFHEWILFVKQSRLYGGC